MLCNIESPLVMRCGPASVAQGDAVKLELEIA